MTMTSTFFYITTVPACVPALLSLVFDNPERALLPTLLLLGSSGVLAWLTEESTEVLPFVAEAWLLAAFITTALFIIACAAAAGVL